MALTFGTATAPLSITTYLDSVFATSLANYRKQLIDNIGATNAVLYEILQSDAYEEAAGGTYIAEQLLYGLAAADSYDGYDELSTLPTDGITQAAFEWRQMASPIVYNMKEVIQNEQRLTDLVKARIQQSELGIQEGWAQAFWWGAQPQGGNIYDPRTSPVNGSYGINPLPLMVYYGTPARTVGGLSEVTYTWWRNHYTTSIATTYSAYMLELESLYNTCALGTGGPPNLMIMDQVSYQLFIHAYFSVYKAHPDAVDQSYPFVAKKFFNAKVVMDDKVPDVYTGAPGTQVGGVVDSSTMTYGSCYFLNTKFFKVRYHSSRNWDILKDENGKSFVKPINGDSRVGHIGWMGNVTCNNRRKQGVLGKIARTLS